MKTKMLATLLLALAMIISACGRANSAGGNSGEESSGSSQSLVFGTGGTSGSYYPIGGALKPILEQSDLVGN
ncbi:C4-dicarboxylate ABC transporter substrate-binding protein, partial [Staphylococcus sp. SIMBA_130]